MEEINGAKVDVRLDNGFGTFRGYTASYMDLIGPKASITAALERVMSDEIVLAPDETFFLPPSELTLAVTLE